MVDQVPYEWEQELGEKLVGVTITLQNLVNSGQSWQTLDEQVQKIKNILPPHMHDVKVYIAKSSEVNAFALPGGHIVFNEGLLRAAQDIEEVLGVAAHELAHVQERHVLRGIVQAFGTYMLIDFIIGDISGIIAVIADNSQLLLRSGFSEQQESEADQMAYELLKAKNSASRPRQFLQKLRKTKEAPQDELLQEVQEHLSFPKPPPCHPGAHSGNRKTNQQDQIQL